MPSFAVHRPHEVEARGLKSRGEREQDRGYGRAGDKERPDAPVRLGHGESNVAELGRKRARHRADDAAEHEPRDSEANRRGSQGEQHAFREQLPDDATARRADRQSNTDLTLASDPAS